MLKKLIQLISHEKRSDNKVSDSKASSQLPMSVETELNTAEDLEDAGNRALKANDLTKAELYCRQSLDFDSNRPTGHNRLAVVLYYLNRFDEALISYDHAISLKPDYADAYYNRGIVLSSLKRFDEALSSYDQALNIKPDYVNAYFNKGIILYSLKQLNEALDCYNQAIALSPDYAEIYNDRGAVLNALKRYAEALTSCERAIALNPDYAMAYNNQGATLYAMKQLDEALASYDHAIALKPDYAEAYNNRGIVLSFMRRPDEALASYHRAITLNPNYAEAHFNRGAVLNDLNRLNEALDCYNRAIILNPNYAVAYNNRGMVLDELKRLDETLTSYSNALALMPDYALLYGHWLDIKMKLCDWSNHNNVMSQLVSKIEDNKNAAPPFVLATQLSSRILQKKATEIYVQNTCPANHSLPNIVKHPKHNKIHIGYFSADFHNHATSYLMAELFEQHDKSKFELIAFSFGPDSKDEMRARVAAAFDQFIDVRDKSDQDVAILARGLEIDIAVDLKGYTQGCRPGIFALRVAPLQINYLGYPGTMGAKYMDYLIADNVLIPKSHQNDYSEKIVYLPDSYQINDTKRLIANITPKRGDLGLPPASFVFCCFNNSYKITPSTFDSWMRILQQVENSILWLLEDNKTTSNNLIKEASFRGVSARRLIFAKRYPLPEHLARHRLADLFLDTLPCNAHTTTSDALWAGLPVLTCLGETFAGRVSASLLSAIQLPELITTTQKDYETLAVSLAKNPDKLAEIKQKLIDKRLTTPLFDTQKFTHNIEMAYIKMYERYQSDLLPDHIIVKNQG